MSTVLDDLKERQQNPAGQVEESDFDQMVEAVPVNYAIVKAENDQLATMARMYPRNEDICLRNMINEIMTAKSMITGKRNELYYKIPNRGEGLTVRAAEIIQRRWGNNTAAVQIQETESGAICTGVFIDLETNVRVSIPKMVSRFQRRKVKDKSGNVVMELKNGRQIPKYEMVKIKPDEFAMLVDNVSSKVYRNSVLRATPPYIKRALIQQIKAIEEAKFKEPGTVDKLVDAFAELGVSVSTLENYLGHPVKGLTQEEYLNFKGIYSAIRDGAITIETAFNLAEMKNEPTLKAGRHSFKAEQTAKEPVKPDETEPEPAKQVLGRCTEKRVREVLAEAGGEMLTIDNIRKALFDNGVNGDSPSLEGILDGLNDVIKDDIDGTIFYVLKDPEEETQPPDPEPVQEPKPVGTDVKKMVWNRLNEKAMTMKELKDVMPALAEHIPDALRELQKEDMIALTPEGKFEALKSL